MEEEIWKDIYYYNEPTNEWVDYRGLYQVSNFGRVKSLDRIINYNHSKYLTLKGKYLKTFKNGKGYLYVQLYKDGILKRYKISRLVYFTFNYGADTKLQVNHIDEDKSNNKLDNLNLMTAKENCNWGTRNDRISDKIKNDPLRSKKIYQFNNEGKFIKEWASVNECGRNGYDKRGIQKCCGGKLKSYRKYIWRYADDIKKVG